MTLQLLEPACFLSGGAAAVNTFRKERGRSMKKALCLALTLALCLSGCVNTTGGKAPRTSQTYTPGTYVGAGEGNGGTIRIEVTFSENAILSAKVVESKETPGVFQQVDPALIDKVIENQSLAVDVIAGATHSSRGVLDAIADGVRQAHGSVDALMIPVAKKASPSVTEDADVVVVGLGVSGIMAAVGAADGGAKVIAVEKVASLANTNATKTTGAWVVGSREEKKYKGALTKEEAFKHLMEGTRNEMNAQTTSVILDRGGDAMNLLLDAGMKFMFAFANPEAKDMLSRGGHIFTSPYEERAAIFEKMLADRKVECLFNTTATELIIESGKIVGVRCVRRDGGKVTLRAKAVVLCTGGFIANPQMIAEHFGGATINVLGNTGCTGDGIRMGQAAGGQIGKNFAISLNEFGASNSKAATKSAKEPWYPQSDVFKLPILGGLLVNAQGRRFMNEGDMCENTMYTSEPVIRNSKYYSVIDQTYVDRLSTTEILKFLGATSNMSPMTASFYNGMILKTLPAQLDAAIAEGWAYKANSVAELAKQFHLNDLETTVAEYNRFCEQGKDERFFKKATYLSPVEKGPFYVVEFEPSAWVTMGGLKTDGSFRVLNADNRPVLGLYAAGADADLWSAPYYQGGSCYGFSMTSGLVAGESAAKLGS